MEAALDLFFWLLSTAVNIAKYLIAIGLYWHFRRIGRTWTAAILWCLTAAYTLAAYWPASIAALVQPDAVGFIVSAVAFLPTIAIAAALFWNPLPEKTYGFDRNEPDDGKSFEVPDEV